MTRNDVNKLTISNTVLNSYNNTPKPEVKKQYDFKTNNPLFMNNEICKKALLEFIDSLENTKNEQDEIDSLYHEFSTFITNEMDNQLNFKYQTKQTRKKFKSHKPYWNSDLTNLWKCYCKKAREFRNFVGPKNRKKYTL